jgi:hypothetical protein
MRRHKLDPSLFGVNHIMSGSGGSAGGASSAGASGDQPAKKQRRTSAREVRGSAAYLGLDLSASDCADLERREKSSEGGDWMERQLGIASSDPSSR